MGGRGEDDKGTSSLKLIVTSAYFIYIKGGNKMIQFEEDPRLQEPLQYAIRTAISKYEVQLEDAKASNERLKEREERNYRDFREYTRKIGLDLRGIVDSRKRQENELEPYLENVRPQLINRDVVSEQENYLWDILAPQLDEVGFRRFEPLDVVLLAPAMESIEGNEGERGNPWIIVNDKKGKINISAKSTGYGDKSWSNPWPSAWAYTLFGYTPTTTGTAQIYAYPALHGFYVVKSDDTCWTSKYAYACLDLWMDVMQNNYKQGWQSKTVFKKDEDNIDIFGNIDTLEQFKYNALVKAGDPVIVLVAISLECKASGAGSYSELNFSTGTANYTHVPLLVVKEP